MRCKNKEILALEVAIKSNASTVCGNTTVVSKSWGVVGILPRKLYSGRKHDETTDNVIYVSCSAEAAIRPPARSSCTVERYYPNDDR